MLRICVTGPESTGKTTLALELGVALHAAVVPEAARLYAERVARELTANDVEPIAREHIALAEAAEDVGVGVVVMDQDLVSTSVYGMAYYGYESAWIEGAVRARLADLYLLCDVDLPWEADGIRDRPLDRAGMFSRFSEALRCLGARVELIRGSGDERFRLALAAVDRIRT